MHPNALLDPLFWEHVAARRRELLSTALRCRAERCGDCGCVSSEADSAGLGVESEPAYTPDELRAA
jgi:hypothetical protein